MVPLDTDLRENTPHSSRGNLLSLVVCYMVLALIYIFHGNTLFVAETGNAQFMWLYRSWTLDAPGGVDSSHGPLVVLCSSIILWRHKEQLASLKKANFYPALVPLFAGLCFHWCGLRAQQPMLSVMSLIVLLWSIPAYIYGLPTAKLTLFPLAYLVFAVPWNFLAGLSFKLRLVASAASEAFLNGIAIPVTRIGTGLIVGVNDPIALDVADPCSGLHSFTALLALTTLYAYFLKVSNTRKTCLILMAIPIAVASNMVRIIVLAVAAHMGSRGASLERFHDASGYVVFIAAVLLTVAAATTVSKWRMKLPTKPCESGDSNE